MNAEASDSDLSACHTPTERRNLRRYQLEVAVTVALFFGLTFLCDRLVGHTSGFLKGVVALAPMIGVLAMLYVFVRFVSRLDEMLRSTLILSGAIAALAASVITFAFGLLEGADIVALPMTFVFPTIALFFAAAIPFVRRCFR